MKASIFALGYAALAAAHGDHGQKSLSGPHESLWYNTLPGDGGKQVRQSPDLVL
jgi:agmatinase